MLVPYLITYDNSFPRDYTALYQLMADNDAVRLAQSVWLLATPASAITVRDAVQATLQRDDKVAVVQLQHEGAWATRNIAEAANDWLSGRLTPAIAA